MAAIAETTEAVAGDRLARRNALVLAVAQGLAGGNNIVIVSTAGIQARCAASHSGPKNSAPQLKPSRTSTGVVP